jgi:hypothetical protein
MCRSPVYADRISKVTATRSSFGKEDIASVD